MAENYVDVGKSYWRGEESLGGTPAAEALFDRLVLNESLVAFTLEKE